MKVAESILENVAEVKYFKPPTGEYRGSPRYQRGEGYGFAHVEGVSHDIFIHIACANRVVLDTTGPELDITWREFRNFNEAVQAIDPPQKGEEVVILEHEETTKGGKPAIQATKWVPFYEVRATLLKIKVSPRHRVQMAVFCNGKSKEKTLVEGNNSDYIWSRYFEERCLKAGETRGIRTEIRIEKMKDGSWVPAMRD